MNRHIITLAGDLAAGKGTVSNILKDKLGYTIYRNGDYFRKLAKENNMTLIEFNKYVEKHPEIDTDIERSAEKYAKENDNLIIDARLGWYVVPKSFKIYLKVDIDEAANRAFLDKKRSDVEKYVSVEDIKNQIEERFKLENERWFNLYKVRKEDLNNYDLVVDTTDITPDEVANIIYTKYIEWLKK